MKATRHGASGRTLLDSECVPTREAIMPTPDNIPTSALTDRQQEVAALIAEGSTNQEIALRLGIERRIVSDHVAQILWRLGATDRVQVAIWAARHRLCQPQE